MPSPAQITPEPRRAQAPTFTLTHATYYGRFAVKFSIVGLVVLIVGRMLLSAFIAYWIATHPEPPPPPTAGFGKLPALAFPVIDPEEKPQSYTLELANGEFPDFGDRAKVFLMPKAPPNLLADQRVRELSSKFGFVAEPQVLNTRTYRWLKTDIVEMSFEMDLQNDTFSWKSNYLSRPDLLLSGELPENYEAVSSVKAALSSAGMLPDDVATSSGKVSFWKSIGGELEEGASLSDADFLRVDLQRTPIDNQFFMYSPDGSRGAISATLSKAATAYAGIVEMEYHYFPVDYTQVETYLLRPPSQAWKILQSGEGYVAKKGTLPTAIVRSVSLGYYDDWQEQEYLQPIYVFEGDGGFVGYVSALEPRFVIAPELMEPTAGE